MDTHAPESLYDFSVIANDGKPFLFSALKGKTVLIVNTASKCGFTPQYTGLEALYKQYAEKGLVVIGFPCDQFAHQEPLSDTEIAQFCQLNHGVTFPLMAKIAVNGKETVPLYRWLKKQAPGVMGSTIKWNFTKFLVASDGVTVKRFAPNVEPEQLKQDIERLLSL
ncbi:glutathione peroxidase [Sphaerochaeta pleomorpha str. Grapes]|uniref:Glutathione peroxidase n=1 Tax=Sphaerochaeta pleomorpha (strain ATCC BAA-1885 / DSM 22778 / Grapes) TaxID=158190 RepID=G8QQ88_SPHPG|nr:glutathione peroxidase [Sphaerochaeta pleomorpha]AEV28665.1 glutathione peroxidase [Sphaerochaeta pleomorpha str. Grapes]